MSNEKKNIDNAELKPLFEWKSPEFLVQKRSRLWYLVVVLIAFSLLALFYWQGNWSGGVLVALATLILVFTNQLRSKEVECQIFETGIVVDDKVYRYEDLKNFWITQVNIPVIRFQTSGRFTSIVRMPASGQEIENLQVTLAKHLPENEQGGEDLVDLVNRIIKF